MPRSLCPMEAIFTAVASIPPPELLCLPGNKREIPSPAAAALWDNWAVHALVPSSIRELKP